MNGKLYNFFVEDHRKLDDILNLADNRGKEYDADAYSRFRRGLLKHIKIEETILFPALEKIKKGEFSEQIAKLRLDHGALTSLMVPLPSESVLKVLRFILTQHNQAEEQPEGLYDLCDVFIMRPDEILRNIKQASDVPVASYKTESYVFDAIKRTVARAGYDYDKIANDKIH